MKTTNYTLENGLNVIFIDTGSFPSATTLLLFGAGSRYEKKENNGIAHFLEHMLFKGSQKYPTAHDVSSTLDGLGGISNAFTSKDYTGYYVKAPTKHFSTVVDIIADIVQHPTLDEKEISKEKGVIAEEINMYEDDPSQNVFNVYEELLYPKHPLGFRIAGTKDTVVNFNRTTFTDYLSSLYHPNNATLVISGGLKSNGTDEESYIKEVRSRFSSWKKKEPITFERIVEAQQKPELLIYHKKTEQFHFCLGFRSFSFFDNRRYALSVLSAILGVGMSSRLFTEVREKRGLCYYIHTYTDSYHDAGSLVTHAGVRADVKQLKEAIKVIIAQHTEILSGEISDKELKKAKEILKGRFLLSLEDTFSVASFFGKKLVLEGETISPTELIERIDAVQKEDVVSCARDILSPANLNMALIGDVKDQELSAFIEKVL